MQKSTGEELKISIIVPSFKQEKTIKRDIESIKNTLDSLPYDYKIIVVIDGKLDKTYERLKQIKSSKLNIVQIEKNSGKGFAVRKGIEKASGDIIGYIDAGMDIDPAGIEMLVNHMVWYDADIIVGSKLHPVSHVNYPIYRKILSWGYRTFTRVLFGFKIRDTQVGLKLFKYNVAKDVFNRSLVKNFAFDVEVLALAYALGYKKIYEAPVKLNFRGNSTITSSSFWKVILQMIIDTIGIFYRLKIQNYYKKSNKKNWITE